MILPCLSEEYIGHICHGVLIDGVQSHDGHMEVDNCGLSLLFGWSHLVVSLDVLWQDVSNGQTLSDEAQLLEDYFVKEEMEYLLEFTLDIVFETNAANDQQDYLCYHGWR